MFKEQAASLLLISLSISVVLALDICEYQMNGVHLLHPADCNKFVECQNGKTASILSCPLGLHFNRFKGMCDLRQRAACDIAFVNFASEETNCSACCALYGCYVNPECPDIPSTPGTDSTPDTPETPDTPATPCIPNTPSTPDTPATPSTPDTPSTPNTPAAPDTPATPSTPDTPATPTTPVSPDTPSTADTPSTPNTPDTPSTPNTPDTPSTPITTRTPPGIPSICSNNLTVCNGKSDGSVVYVNGTCNQYIVCVGGCANIMSCPDNLQYNIDTKICDYPQNVDCPWQSTPPVTGPSGVACAHHGQCAGQVDGKLFASSNGNGYIVCQCECEIERPCPAGTKFNEELLSCARETIDGSGNGNATNNVICSTDTKICKNQTDGSLFPIDGVCNKFYKCNKGCAVEILCPNNLIYNPNTEYCDYSQNYKCPWPYSPPTGPSAGPSGIACPSGGRCTGQAEGTLFPSPNSCSKYVVCHCECEVEKNCSNGLYWDNDQLTCNYSANVKCDLT